MRLHLRGILLLLLLSACAGREELPGEPPPPPPKFTDAVEEALGKLPEEKDFLAEKPGRDLAAAAELAMVDDFRMAARGWRDLKAEWPRSAAALAPLLLSARVPGPKKVRILDWAAGMGGRAAVQLCRLALEGRPDQAVEPRRRAVVLLGELGGPAEIPVLILRLKYEEYGDPYALAWTARSLALHKNLSGLPFLLGLLAKGGKVMEEAGRILVEILGWEGISWKKGGTWAELKTLARRLMEEWRREGRAPKDAGGPPPPALERELLLRLKACLRFNMRYQDDAAFILARSGKAALPALRTAFRDRHTNIRFTAVFAARKLGPFARTLCPDLASLIADRTAGIYAVEALGLLGCAKADPYLLRLAAGRKPDLRQAALLALGRTRCKSALPLMEKVLADSARAPEERMAAALSLGLLGAKERALAILSSMRKDPQVHRPTLEEYIRELKEGRPPSR